MLTTLAAAAAPQRTLTPGEALLPEEGSTVRLGPDEAAYVLHIPKTAVTSFLHDCQANVEGCHVEGEAYWSLQVQLPSLNTTSMVQIINSEGCFAHGEELGRPVATFIREPRAHVVSQYYHCRLSPDHEYARSLMPHTIDEWVGAWAQGRPQDKAAFATAPACVKAGVAVPYCCYIPWDLQTQRLTCERANDNFTWTNDARVEDKKTWPKYAVLRPKRMERQMNLTFALENARKAHFVGIVEAYQESVCLFAARTSGVQSLPAFCDCENDEAWRQFHSVEDAHGDYETPSPDSLPLEVLERIDEMTTIDRALYAAMVRRFLDEVRSVEQVSGRLIVCEGTRSRLLNAVRAKS